MDRYRVPKKIDFARKPYRGVTLRQMIYLILGAAAGGLLLINEIGGLDLVVRGVIALAIFAVFAALAYVPVQGGHLDSWLPHLVKFLVRPRLRVWRKTGADGVGELAGPVEMVEPPPLAPAQPPVPAAATQESILDRPLQDLLPYGVWIEILVIVVLVLVTIFLVQGGYEVLEWFLR